MTRTLLAVPAALLLACGSAAPAAILFTGSYTQSFNTLQSTPNVDANAGTAPAWTNDTTLPGWYGGGSQPLTAGYGVGDGSDNTMLGAGTVAVASFGSTGNSDRALAPLKRNTSAYIALALTNDTGLTLSEITVSYTGEQWRDNATQAAGLVGLDFAYQVGATDITSGTWTDVNALDFVAPKTSNSGTLDGNLAANREAISSTITGLSLAGGQTIWLRWQQRGSGNNGSYVAVDDLSLSSPIPEPASLLLATVGGLLLLPRRR